jgi:predicted nucleic acid-binding Zn finger protein
VILMMEIDSFSRSRSKLMRSISIELFIVLGEEPNYVCDDKYCEMCYLSGD